MNVSKCTKMSLTVTATLLIAWAGAAVAQEVSTKVVGFVKVPVQTGGSQTYLYSIPFQSIGQQDTKHYLNVDADNDGTYESASEMFSGTHFQQGDLIKKFDRSSGRFERLAQYFDANVSQNLPISGWYEQAPPFFLWTPTSMYFSDGEGFIVQYATPLDETRGELFFLGEVEDVPSEIPIVAGYNVIGIPFPSNTKVVDAFTTSSSNPTAGIQSDPFGTGDFIKADYNGTAFDRLFVYFDQGAGPKWYEQKPPFFFWEETDYEFSPTEVFLYYARNPFTWTVNSPIEEQ